MKYWEDGESRRQDRRRKATASPWEMSVPCRIVPAIGCRMGSKRKRTGVLKMPGASFAILFFVFLSNNPVSGINTYQCADKHDDGAVFMPFHIIHPIHLFSF